MEWLHLLDAHPGALASFQAWLKQQIDICNARALDIALHDIPLLKGRRDAFREIIGYINNNTIPPKQG